MDELANSSSPLSEAVDHLGKAYSFKAQFRFADALEECDKVIQLSPDWADPHYLKGLLLESLDRNVEALASFNLAVQLDPTLVSPKTPFIPHSAQHPEHPEQISYRSATPWSAADVWWGLLLWFGLTVAMSLGFVLVSEVSSISEDSALSALIVLGSLLWLVPVWWFSTHKYGSGLVDLGFRRFEWANLGIGVGLLFGVQILTAIYGGLLTEVFDREMQEGLETITEDMSLPWLLPLTAVIAAPIVEEVFFRGFLFAGLRGRYGWKKAALISSAIFAAIHFQPFALPPIFALGYLFAYLYHRSNSLWVPIILHFSVNLFAVLMEFVVVTD